MSKPIGYCLCGAVRFAFDASAVFNSDICHCESCRRACASPLTAGFAVRDTAWRWTGDAPRTYRSSNGVTRSFCPTCGTQMAYANADLPNETHFYLATLDDPAMIVPQSQVFKNEALPWVADMLDLPERD